MEFFVVRIDQLLGKGGFACVFQGTFRSKYNSLDTDVAIKRILLDHLRYDEQLENNREQTFMLQLHHTNILRLLHVQDDPQFRFTSSHFRREVVHSKKSSPPPPQKKK